MFISVMAGIVAAATVLMVLLELIQVLIAVQVANKLDTIQFFLIDGLVTKPKPEDKTLVTTVQEGPEQ